MLEIEEFSEYAWIHASCITSLSKSGIGIRFQLFDAVIDYDAPWIEKCDHDFIHAVIMYGPYMGQRRIFCKKCFFSMEDICPI